MANNALTVGGHPSVRKALEVAEKWKGAVDRYRKQGELTSGRVIKSALTLSGGVVSGALRAKGYGKIDVLNSDTDMVVGTALMLVSYTGMAGKHSDNLGDFANGLLAVYAARAVETALAAAK